MMIDEVLWRESWTEELEDPVSSVVGQVVELYREEDDWYFALGETERAIIRGSDEDPAVEAVKDGRYPI